MSNDDKTAASAGQSVVVDDSRIAMDILVSEHPADVIQVSQDSAMPEQYDFLEEVMMTNRRQLNKALVYGVNEEPSLCLTMILAVQNVVTTIGGIIFIANVLAPKLCILPEDPARSYLVSTTVMMAGISTLLQTVLGVRLPIVQTSGFVFMVSTMAITNLPRWQCPANVDLFSMGPDARTLEWQLHVRDIQGAIIVVGVIQMLMGYSGFIGKLLKYITPLTVVPTMCLIGLTVVKQGVLLMSGNWIAAIITLFFLTLFSQYLRKIDVSLPIYSSTKGLIHMRLKIFALFSIILSVGIMWIACIYLTSENSLLPTDPANTESKAGVLRNSLMVRLPYPFQWGWPIFRLSSILTMLPALLTSIVESVGNYYTCARFACLTPPPVSVVNRGIGLQGISSIFVGFLGTGSGCSTSSENVGNIGITKVCSRKVIIFAAWIMICIAPITKLMAMLVTLPDPVLGAVTSVLLVLIAAIALSNLQFINLNSIRNMYILGMSMFFGLVLPEYISTNQHLINTKYVTFNEVIFVYLSSGIFIGGLIGFILDNTIPGDSDNTLDSPYHMSDDEERNSVGIEDERIYKISDRIFEKINYFISFFV